ncbi:MAG: RES family NAD+ phosphorylase [Treponema sp.]|nr:RES family NAD+ phosphorylase [Candidatus Treponema equifaecale]
MVVYRIARKERIEDLTGTGARLFGGRWNYAGIPAVYASSTLSLAMCEILVHTPKDIPPINMAFAEIYVPDYILPLKFTTLKEDEISQERGSTWLKECKELALKVQSVILPPVYKTDFNVILNPLHPDFAQVKVVNVWDIDFDTRFFEG